MFLNPGGAPGPKDVKLDYPPPPVLSAFYIVRDVL